MPKTIKTTTKERKPREKKLTDKMRRFCEKFVELGNMQEAYRQSYDAANMKGTSINAATQGLMKNPLITTYVEEIRSKAKEKFEHTLEDSIRIDKKIVADYEKYMAVLQNPNAEEKELIIANRVLSVMKVASINAAQDRIAKKMGFYEKDKEKHQIVYTVNVTKEEIKDITKELNDDV